MEMMVFVVISKNGRLIHQGQQIDDGAAAYGLAKSKNADIRLWEMYGLDHLSDLPMETRQDIKAFVNGLK